VAESAGYGEGSTPLLAAALDLVGELALPQLAARVSGWLGRWPGVCWGAMAPADEERREYTIYSGGAPADDESVIGAPSVTLAMRDGDDGARAAGGLRVVRVADAAKDEVLSCAADTGARWWLQVPLFLQDRSIGWLGVGFRDEAEPTTTVRQDIVDFARLLGPLVWNALTEERFARGDRRRDVLITLSASLNQSLESATVVQAARQALEELVGAGQGEIWLLSDGRTSCDVYALGREGSEECITRGVARSGLERVLLEGAAYESDDLAAHCRAALDAAWRARGMRRYVALPLRARGRIVGALVMGNPESGAIRRIDIWLYENIALQLALALDNARQHEEVRRLSDRLAQQNVYLREEIQSEHDFGEIVGRSPAIRRLQDDIRRVAPTEAAVLITGETGVGKELVARAIHALSPRAAQPLVKVNCAALPEGTVESELFGHERGAFTSAIERRIGRFELAHDATLFLDEVGELPAGVQAKLLRVLQDGEFERVGGTRTIKTNARIITATNRALLAEVAAGRFRRDLYYRLNVFPLVVAPLRERREDIPLLVETFVAQLARRMGKHVDALDRPSLEGLMENEWPGNVRELRHVIERALILCDGPCLRIDINPTTTTVRVAPRTVTPTPANVDTPPPVDLAAVKDLETELLRRALAQTNWIVEGPRGAARLLGLSASTLRYRMRRLGMRRRDGHEQATNS